MGGGIVIRTIAICSAILSTYCTILHPPFCTKFCLVKFRHIRCRYVHIIFKSVFCKPSRTYLLRCTLFVVTWSKQYGKRMKSTSTSKSVQVDGDADFVNILLMFEIV